MHPGDVIGERYVLRRKVGEGGMGTVWHAVHANTERPVALKLLHPNVASGEDARKRFMREARASARINHPNIVDVLDAGQLSDGTPFLAMQLLDGMSLAEAMKAHPPLSLQDFLVIVADTCKALAAAHTAGIIHRDVKPENIFIHRERNAEFAHGKVLDFGISKFLTEVEGMATTTGAIVGSPHFMSPEQVMGQAEVDGRADIWSIGVLLFRGTTGRWPHVAEGFTGLCVAISVQPPADIDVVAPTLPPRLRRLIKACLSPLPLRIADADAIAAELEALAADDAVAPLVIAASLYDPRENATTGNLKVRTPISVPPVSSRQGSSRQRIPTPAPAYATPVPGSVSQASVAVATQTVVMTSQSPRPARQRKWPGQVAVLAAVALLGGAAFIYRARWMPPAPVDAPAAAVQPAPTPTPPVDETSAPEPAPAESVAEAPAPSAQPSAEPSAEPSQRPKQVVRRRPASSKSAGPPAGTGVPGENLGSGL